MLWEYQYGWRRVPSVNEYKLAAVVQLMGRMPENWRGITRRDHSVPMRFFRSVDFWTACEHGGVEKNERRAVELLRSLCDEERFGIYCQTSHLPVRGNLTGRTYLIERQGNVWELEKGKYTGKWCIHSQGLPPTDNVIATRGLIEGNEQEFMAIGNYTSLLNRPINPTPWLPKVRIPHIVEL